MLATEEWEIQRSRNGWQNLYLPRPEFVKFLEEQELVIGNLMLEMGFIRESAP
jgi:putative tricarboxylic transport membrane protein